MKSIYVDWDGQNVKFIKGYVFLLETQSANIASCKLLEKLGMKVTDTVRRFGETQSIYSIHSYKKTHRITVSLI
jgi:hypothetical protein